jgi:glycosyltransferase involved in cell wall biosynthesis
MDRGSSDGSIEIILRQYQDCIYYWESKPDRGIYHAWNKGLDHVTGDWVNFLGADDYSSEPEVLDLAAAGIARYSLTLGSSTAGKLS